jgi:hypothetical protein
VAARKLTEAQRKECVAEYVNGSSVTSLAHKYAVDRRGLYRLIKSRTPLKHKLRRGSENPLYRGGKIHEDSAHEKVRQAISAGKLVRPARCSKCDTSSVDKNGRSLIQAHHNDYNKPLDVTWFCKKCHFEWHRHNTPIPYKGSQE